MVNLSVGDTHLLRDEGTGETAQLAISDIIESRGQLVVYGQTRPYTIHVPATLGVVAVPARPSCFPVFPRETAEDVLRFMAALDSRPLVLVLDSEHRLPVVNVTRHNVPQDKDSMVRRASELIQVWEEWRILGTLPLWYRDILRAPLAARAGGP